MTFYEELELDIDQRVSPSLTLTVFVMLAEGEGETLHQSATYEVRYSQPVLSLVQIYLARLCSHWLDHNGFHAQKGSVMAALMP